MSDDIRLHPDVENAVVGIANELAALNENTRSLKIEIRESLKKAVSALKPAPSECEECKRWYDKLQASDEHYAGIINGLKSSSTAWHDEAMRLQKLVADQALTIGTLKDTTASKDRLIADLKASVLHQRADLQRFRSREEKVTKLIHMVEVLQYDRSELAECCDAAFAVRDFKVTE